MAEFSVGLRIKEVRESKGITAAELARKANMKKQSVYKYERGIIRNIPYTTVKRIADALDVNPAYIVGWSKDIIRPVDIAKDPIPEEEI